MEEEEGRLGEEEEKYRLGKLESDGEGESKAEEGGV